MTVSTLNNRTSAAGNGVTTVFSFPNRFLLDADLVVLEVNDTTGVETTKTLTTHYTVSGAGDAAGGSVTMLTAPASGVTLVIYRDPALTQPIDLVNGDDLDVDTGIERGLDRNTLQIQRLRDLVDRSMRLSDGDTSGATVQLPVPAANTLLGWDSAGAAIENKVPVDVGLATVTAFAATLLDDATAAAARTTLDAVSTAQLAGFITDQTALTAPAVDDTLLIYDLSAAANREIALSDTLKVVNGLTEDTTPDRGADFILSYDTSATAAKKVKLDTIIRYEDVRQTVVAGAVDANGQANFLSAGTGLAVSMAATTTPVIGAFAAGEDEIGPINYRKRFTADAADYWSALAAWNTSHLFFDRDAGTGAVTAYKTLVPPQYGAFFDVNKQSQLDFDTNFTDKYTKTWTAVGNAAVSGGKLVCDGTGDGLRNTSITSLGDGGWTLEGDYTFTALPVPGTHAPVFMFVVSAGATNIGMRLSLYNNAGTIKLTHYLSSDGSTANIANNSLGTKASWLTATKYHVAINFDPVAGRYYTYVDGVLDHTSISTQLKICGIGSANIGISANDAESLNGTVDNFRFSPCCRYPNGTTFTPPASAFTPDAEWFDLSTFTWKYGSPTSWTTKQRVCVGEVTTNATVPTSTITYALRGKYVSPLTTIPASGTAQSFSHYIGRADAAVKLTVVCVTADKTYVPGDRVVLANAVDAAAGGVSFGPTGRNTASAVFGTGIPAVNKSAATLSNITTASWKYELSAAAP